MRNKYEKMENGNPVMVEQFEKLSLNFSILLFAICVNLLHPYPSSFLYGLLYLFGVFSIFVIKSIYFQIPFNLTVVLQMVKITQNNMKSCVPLRKSEMKIKLAC